jgi:hypothetical protein
VYVDNKELLKEVESYKKTKIMSEVLGGMILQIAKNYATRGSFAGYTWTDDMIGEAVLTCVKYLKSFDSNKYKSPNPFAYITKICENSFIAYIKNQNKHSKIKNTLYCTYDDLAGDSCLSIDYTDLRADFPKEK